MPMPNDEIRDGQRCAQADAHVERVRRTQRDDSVRRLLPQPYVGDLHFPRAPSPFGGAEHVGGPGRGLDRVVGQDGGDGIVRRYHARRRGFLRSRVTSRELLLLGRLDVGDVGADDPLRIAKTLQTTRIQPQRIVAEALDQPERVRDEQNRLAAALELGELVQALVREALVADREYLVNQQHIRIDVDRDGESQPHVHAGRVCLDRRVDELLHLGEVDDLVEATRHLALREAQHDAVDEDVLPSGNLRMKARAQFDQR